MAESIPQAFINHLGLLEMEPGSPGLRFVKDLQGEKNPYIYLALEQAKQHGAQAVYFRFFPDDRPPKPQIFIFDNTHKFEVEKKVASSIHKNLWNSGVVPMCLFISTTEIVFLNCFEKPYGKKGLKFCPFQIIKLTSKIHKELLGQFSAQLFDSGLFWDSDQGKRFNYQESAYQQLLAQLKIVRKKMVAHYQQVEPATIKRLLVMLILIKYLEDRKDENGKSALVPGEFYPPYSNKESTLADVLRSGANCLEMFRFLCSKEHFNGQIFHLNEDEEKAIKSIDLELFSKFVEGDISFTKDKSSIGQLSLWRLYSFNYLPIELISHIYEDFLEDAEGRKDEGVVYTPPSLVQFLIDQTLPLNLLANRIPKVLDPACGSGIFLVGVFKRLIQAWRVRNHFRKPGKKDIEDLQAILSQSIYGCDIVPEAVNLTYFSLGLALLDALSPKEIWGNVHFENLLEKNLFSEDYFSLISDKKLPSDFDLIIGNPPFNSKLTEPGKEIEKKEKAHTGRPSVPDQQIALLFLEQSLKLLAPKGKCCLLLSSGPLIYNLNSTEFRNHLISNYRFESLYDFTALRPRLFQGSKAKPATLAILAANESPEDNPIHHIILRWTSSSGEKIEFETDYYDIHSVSQEEALENPRVWQTNFMGGGRLHEFVERISKFPTLESYLKEKEKLRGWKAAEGWIEAPNSKPLLRIRELEGKGTLNSDEEAELIDLRDKHIAEYITGKPFVDQDDFTADGILKVDNCEVKYFYRSASGKRNGTLNRIVFEPPHLLIKENAGGDSIPVEFRQDYLTFKHNVIGIHSPKEDQASLRAIESFLKSPEAFSLLWVFSGQIITTREGVPLKGDILSLPFAENLEHDPSPNEKIFLEDIKNHLIDFRIKGENSQILKPVEKNDEATLDNYGETFCKILNSVYDDFKPSKPIISDEFICFPFYCGEEPDVTISESIDEMESHISGLLAYKSTHNLWVKRIIRVFEKNVIYRYYTATSI